MAKAKTKAPKRASKALVAAIRANDVETVKKCLAKGERPDTTDEDGKLLVCVGGGAAIRRALLEAGADPDTLRYEDETLLTHECEFAQVPLIKVLLEFKADPNANDGGPLRKLVVAEKDFSGNALKVLPLLAKAGADLDRVTDWLEEGDDDDGDNEAFQGTALMRAIQTGRAQFALALIEHGADINAKNEHGETALGIALRTDLSDVKKVLARKGASPGKQRPKPTDHMPQRYSGTFVKAGTKGAVHSSGDPDVASIYRGKFPGCGNPPVHLLTLDLRAIDELPDEIKKLGRLHVVHLNCGDCSPPDFYHLRIGKDGTLSADPKEHADDLAAECEKDSYTPSRKKSWVKLEPGREHDYIEVGGKPSWVQWDGWTKCSKCRKKPFFVAKLWQHGLPPGAEGEGHHLYVFVCAKCRMAMFVRQMT